MHLEDYDSQRELSYSNSVSMTHANEDHHENDSSRIL